MSLGPPPFAALDHLVVGAITLADGIDYIATLTGVVPQPGGKHVAMGTHNAVLRLGERVYLEVIAVDPEGGSPAHRRWFDLDDIALQAELMDRPRLIHWVARTTDIEATAARSPIPLGTVHAMSRGDFRWRITIPDDGTRPGKGIVPTLIQWDVPSHPADRLTSGGVSLTGFAASHSDSDRIRAALAALGLEGTLAVTYDREARLVAMLRTPRGTVTLSS